MSKLKIALQKSGRLSEDSFRLLKECGVKFQNGSGQLIATSTNFPLEILLLRDDDIPPYVEQSVADIGIVGENMVLESQKRVVISKKLGFSKCRLSLAVPKKEAYQGLESLKNKKVATSFPHILSTYFKAKNIPVNIETISGSVEIAPGIGLADAIGDIVSTGSTLFSNGLKEVEKVMDSQAVLIKAPQLNKTKQIFLEQLLFRIRAVQKAKASKYILLNAPNSRLEEIIKILPGMKSPTILPLATSGWSSLHSVIAEDTFWEKIDALKMAQAEGILIVPIEKMIL